MPNLAIPAEIWTSILCSLSILLFPILFGHGPLRVKQEGMRIRAAIAAAGILWLLLLWATRSLMPHTLDDWLNLAAGASVYAAAILAALNYWAIVCWGITLTTLLTIRRADAPMNTADLMAGFGSGMGIQRLFASRVELLGRTGMAILEDDTIRITPRGRLLGVIVTLLNQLFVQKETE